MTHTILERVLLSSVLVAAYAAAVWAYVAVGRWRARLQLRRNTLKGVVGSGNPTLLYFWSTGCAQCRPQEEHIEQAQRSLERSGRSIAVRKHDALVERELSKSMRVMTVPTTVLFDARGNVVAWNPGLTPWQKLLDQFESVGLSIASSSQVPNRDGRPGSSDEMLAGDLP